MYKGGVVGREEKCIKKGIKRRLKDLKKSKNEK
jgi:hypothetical protein